MVISAPHAGKIDQVNVNEGVQYLQKIGLTIQDSVNGQDLIAKIIKEGE